ncbi:hypothetical protein FCM96_02920 [Mycoplasma bovis]|uniref:MAG3090 family protein n=1 Tax=Mycoplasmopsis bovis TaxID=28903 RepID=UPI001BDF17BD|nr:hypothetical protein [Mycoplasmopsis bovis]MBT1345260.1 hypothetical protein [Mycoplasmopsis bovis]MBT1396116.1 hypothetical protein [Mycoplasmopsis bovis]MBT1418915.1 hypothetical protein [Mycoplasmopsis bovis]MBT1419612.1 hypothetical protein [Mycoplasmopsis bovis]UJB25186.1 hypothetical protein FG864_01575 [Mycoplasmopsis bovis]
MKRLNCTYEIKQDNNFPWLLKHPKVKKGLAKFKTREEALNWYMLLDYETAVWFQDNQKIFAGQLTIDYEDGEWYYYIKTKDFDGDATYDGVCHELGINPYNYKRDRDAEIKKGKKLVEGRDYILISDPATYFPLNLEISKRKRKDVVDIEHMKVQYETKILSLQEQINSNDEHISEELKQSREELAKKELELKEISNKINLLKQNTLSRQEVKYVQFIELKGSDIFGATALYNDKIKKAIESLDNKKISWDDFNRIKKNFSDFESSIVYKKSRMSDKGLRLISILYDEFKTISIELLSKLEPIDDLDDSFANRAFYKGSEGKLISVSWELSFVLVEFMHVGFVPEDEYTYSIPYLVERSKYLVTLIDAGDNNKIVTFQPGLEQTSEIELDEAKEDVVETKTVQLSEKAEIKEETKKPTLIYYELAKPEPIAEPEPVAVAEEKTEVVPEVSEPTEVKETTIIIYNLVKEEPAVEKEEAPVVAAEDEVKEASVIPVVVEEKPVEVEEVETIKPVENQPYFYEDRVASNVAIEDYTLPAEKQMPAATKEEAKEKGTVAKKNILFYVAVTLLVLLIIAIVTISILGIVHLTTDIKFFKSL